MTTQERRPKIAAQAAHPESTDDASTIVAYALQSEPIMPIVPASQIREWIDATDQQFARRCLPLLIANQAGWFVLSSHHVSVTWNGGSDQDALTLEWLSGEPPYPALSHFGHGILTWTIPYLFRTPPGTQLLVRGPANWPKDGVTALEGLVETDWSVATFTMNWFMTAVDHPVEFEVGEPICMLVPQQVSVLEAFQPELRDLAADPAMYRAFSEWSNSRRQYLADLKVPDSEAAKQRWQKDYFRGRTPSGEPAAEHRTKLQIAAFRDYRAQ
jgi:hypothetical protein